MAFTDDTLSLRVLVLFNSPENFTGDYGEAFAPNVASPGAHKNGNGAIVLCVSFSPVGTYSGKTWYISDSSLGASKGWERTGKSHQ